MSKATLIQEYRSLYRSIHGVWPKGLDLPNWRIDELTVGITTLKAQRGES